jgi:hypothetical protein
VPFLAPVLGNHAILAGCVCANLLARGGLVGPVRRGFLGSNASHGTENLVHTSHCTRLSSLYSPFLEGGNRENKKKSAWVLISRRGFACRVDIALPRLCGFVPVGSVHALTRGKAIA